MHWIIRIITRKREPIRDQTGPATAYTALTGAYSPDYLAELARRVDPMRRHWP